MWRSVLRPRMALRGAMQRAVLGGVRPGRPRCHQRQHPGQQRRGMSATTAAPIRMWRWRETGGSLHRPTALRLSDRQATPWVPRARRRWMQLSIKLLRYCSVGTTTYSSSFNGVSFPGTLVGSTDYSSLAPSYVPPCSSHRCRARTRSVLVAMAPPRLTGPPSSKTWEGFGESVVLPVGNFRPRHCAIRTQCAPAARASACPAMSAPANPANVSNAGPTRR